MLLRIFLRNGKRKISSFYYLRLILIIILKIDTSANKNCKGFSKQSQNRKIFTKRPQSSRKFFQNFLNLIDLIHFLQNQAQFL